MLDLFTDPSVLNSLERLKAARETESRICGEILSYQKVASSLMPSLSAEETDVLTVLYADVRRRMSAAKKALSGEREKIAAELRECRGARVRMGVLSMSPSSLAQSESALCIDILS